MSPLAVTFLAAPVLALHAPSGRKGEFVKAICTMATLKKADGHIDVEKTIEALERVQANAIVLQPAYEKQWEDILNFLPEATRRGIKVFLLLPDARRGAGPCGKGRGWWWQLPKPYCRDYVKWMEELAKLSLKYPALRGVFIDDFECGAFSPTGGFTVEYIRKVMGAKNRINPGLMFLPGIYLPRGLCQFRITQKGGSVRHMRRLVLSASYGCEREPREARLVLITSGHGSEYLILRLSVNGEVVFADRVRGRPRMISVNLKVFDPKRWEFKFEALHTGFHTWQECFVSLRLILDGREVPLDWHVESDDERFLCEGYATGRLKPYYELTDGVIFWSNAFDLSSPEVGVFRELMGMARKTVGEEKVIFGHFYGAEPWKEPIFASRYYFDSFVRLTMETCDGVAPWFPCLLPYFVGYSSGIYSQPKCDRPGFDFRFHYPGLTSYELGFYQGITAEVEVPRRLTDAAVSFRIVDDSKRPYTGRWVKEFVVGGGSFIHRPIPSRELVKEEDLWFEERGTVWHDFLSGDEGVQEVRIPFERLRGFLMLGRRVRLTLRMRADMFRGAGSAPPEVNVYVTRPVVTVNGRNVEVNWRFESGNALEKLWLPISMKVVELFSER